MQGSLQGEKVPAEEIEKIEFTRVNSFFFVDIGDGSVWHHFRKKVPNGTVPNVHSGSLGKKSGDGISVGAGDGNGVDSLLVQYHVQVVAVVVEELYLGNVNKV